MRPDLTSQELLAAEAAKVAENAVQPPSLGKRAVRGVIITAVVGVTWELLRAFAGLLTARFLRPADFALAAIAISATLIAPNLLAFNIDKRLVQVLEDPGDAYDYGFSLMVWLAFAYAAIAALAGLVASRLYNDPLILPLCAVLGVQGFTLAASLPAVYLQREMRWWRQRLIITAGPLAGVLVTLALAIAGAGAWAVILGTVTIGIVSGGMLWIQAPRRPRFRLHVPREALHFFLSFGWPLWAAGMVAVIAGNGLVLEVKLGLGIATLGLFRVAINLGDRIDTAESIIASVLLPVLSRTRDMERLRRAFILTSRIVLVWAIPTGIGLALFADDITRYVLGPRWTAIVPLLRVEGIGETLNAIGTLYLSYYMVIGDNRPSLWLGLQINLMMLAMIGVLTPFYGFNGLLVALVVAAVFGLFQRRRYIKKLFPGIPVLRTALPIFSAGVLAALAVLGLERQFGMQSPAGLAVRLVCFLGLFGVIAFFLERKAVAEAIALVRDSRSVA